MLPSNNVQTFLRRAILLENPSLQSYLLETLDRAYQDGVDLAVRGTNLP